MPTAPLPLLLSALAALSAQDPDREAIAPPVSAPPVMLEAAPVALASLSDEAVFAKAAGAVEAIDTLTARFVQTAPSGNVSTGRVHMDRPGRLRFEYDAPSAQIIVATGGMVYVHDADLETTDSYPLGTTPLRHLLGDRIDSAGAELDGVQRGEDEVAITLRAADGEAQDGALALVFDVGEDQSLSISRWAAFDPRGGVTVVELEDIESGGRMSRRLFRVPEAGGFGLEER